MKFIICFLSFLYLYASYVESFEEEEAQQQVGEILYGVILEEHHHIVKREADQPIRVQLVPDSLESLPSYVADSLLPALERQLESLLMVRPINVPIRLRRQCTGGAFFPTPINETLRCSSTCLNETRCGLMVVPESHLRACIECNGNSSTCQQTVNQGEGVSDADLLIYVTAIQDPVNCIMTEGVGAIFTLAFAIPCQLESGLDRPIAAAINFCPAAINAQFQRSGVAAQSYIYYTALHEIIHTLGFSRQLFPFWRTEDGQPRTERNEFGYPPIAYVNDTVAGFEWSNTTIQEVTYDNWSTFNGLVNHSVHIMVTPNVVEHGRRHFNCSTLRGVELENQGGPATELSHWEKRTLGNEIMTGIIDVNPVLSNLTLAALEDSGWYRVNFNYGKTLDWGHNSGCVFASESCFEFMLQQILKQLPYAPFCWTSPDIGHGLLSSGCTVGREFVSLCNLATYSAAIPVDYQYFSNPEEGGNVIIADYCPFQSGFNYIGGRTTRCSNSSNQLSASENYLGEFYGPNSACFNHANTWTYLNETRNRVRGSGCYMYTCDTNNTELTIFVSGYPYTCTEPGQTLTVNNNGFNGQFRCPIVPSFARLCEEVAYTPITTPSPSPISTPTISPTDGAVMFTATMSLFLLLLSIAVMLTM